MKRRRFLYSLMSGALLGCAPTVATESSAPQIVKKNAAVATSATNYDVIVVGAGIAGLAAAQAIKAAGKRVVVIEARSRVGGRIWSWRNWGKPIELGANWIHTKTGNPLVNLAKQAGVSTTSDPEEAGDERLIDTVNGTSLTGSALESHYTRAYDIIESAVARGDNLDTDVSLRASINQVSAFKQLNATNKRLFESMLAQIVDDEYAIESEKVSLFGYEEENAAYTGSDLFVNGGYDGIATHVAKGLTIIQNTVVTKIAWGKSGVTVTAGSKAWQAKAVIVTLPLGVLKANKVTFTPALPSNYQTAINQLATGVLNRCILKFDTAFWGDTYSTFTIVGNDPHQWYQMIPLNGPYGIPALAAFNAGSQARALEAKTDAQLTAEMTAIVQKAFGTKKISNGMVATRWGSDPYALGAYSYVPVGSPIRARTVLATPVSAQLAFAGEAYTNTDPSTVHGAYNSGRAAASAILKTLK